MILLRYSFLRQAVALSWIFMSFFWFTAFGTAHTAVWVGAGGVAALCFAFTCSSASYLFGCASVGFVGEVF